MERGDRAVELKHNGHNCCQAVLAAFQEELALEPELLRQLGAPFGTGLGCMEGTCGALVAAALILGRLKSEGKPMHPVSKELVRRFREAAGDTVCRRLKGIDTGEMLCSCDDCVRIAADLAEEFLA